MPEKFEDQKKIIREARSEDFDLVHILEKKVHCDLDDVIVYVYIPHASVAAPFSFV